MENHVGGQPLGAKGVVELGAAGKAEHIGDQRVLGQRLEGQLIELGQRMSLGHQHAAIPAIAGQQHQVVEQLQRLGADREVGLAIADHLGNLLGRALLHVQRHIGVFMGELADHRRQRIACLGMGGGDRQAAATLIAVLLGHLLDVVGQPQHLAGQLDDGLPRRGHPGQVLAAAGEDFHAQLVLEQTNLLGDPRLRGKQALRRGRHIEVVARHFPDIAQLLKFHEGTASRYHQDRPRLARQGPTINALLK